MDVFRNLRKIFFTGPVDKDIANNYFEIQNKIDEIRKILEPLLYKYRQQYMHSMDAKPRHDIEFIDKLLHRIIPLFGQIWEERNVENVSAEFQNVNTEYKEYVLYYQNKLITLLAKVHDTILDLDKPHLLPKEADLSQLCEELEKILANESLEVKLDEKVAVRVNQLVEKILANAKTERFRIDGRIVDLTYYCEERSRPLLLLQNLPLLKLTGIRLRPSFLVALHRDKSTFRIPHYNILFESKNIHVFPGEYKGVLEQLRAT